MQYACLIYGDGNVADPLPRSEMEKYVADVLAYHEQLRQGGRLTLSQGLDRENKATVKKRNGKITTTDGPFMETKEQIAGLFVIEARDLNEALRIVADHPLADGDTIEVHAMFDP
ncbi:MAG TPA: YciI family protein [Verrucomicrobiae bacterium]|nr:YciI family protein [Verrucomicrobiae bacterium]HTZ53745.1 YciI family protein [Candidatus Acidoferrum sp.]